MEDGWVRGPMRHMLLAFEQSLREHPPIAPGAADDVDPAAAAKTRGRAWVTPAIQTSETLRGSASVVLGRRRSPSQRICPSVGL